MSTFKNTDGKSVLLKMVKGIQDNKAYLGEVDGLIGDGDHGMNMNKGFTVFETRFADKEIGKRKIHFGTREYHSLYQKVIDRKTAGHSSHKATVSGYFRFDNDTLL